MRADATANRQRVLAAAEQVFAEQGLGASTEEIARRAGVGIGTVFRHFPVKRDLVESVLLARFAELTELARAAESRRDVTPAFFELVEQLMEHVAAKRAMVSYLSAGDGSTEAARQASAELSAVIERILRRAQRAGGVRDDIGTDELFLLILGLAQPVAGLDRDAARKRAGRVVLDGLRVTPPG
jgi:AcrR family transcriptional regulator